MMIKMRALWPSNFNQEMANDLRDKRKGVVDEANPFMVNLDKAREIRDINKMAGEVRVVVFEGEEVRRLERVWASWVRYAK
jgi:hypothetical protein